MVIGNSPHLGWKRARIRTRKEAIGRSTKLDLRLGVFGFSDRCTMEGRLLQIGWRTRSISLVDGNIDGDNINKEVTI